MATLLEKYMWSHDEEGQERQSYIVLIFPQ